MTEPKVLIREAQTEDAVAIGDLMEQVDEVHRQALPHIFQRPLWPIHDRGSIATILADEDSGIFVAEDHDSRLVGFVFLTIQESQAGPLWVPRRFAVVESIGVLAEQRRSGVASDLIRIAETWAASRDAEAVELNVYEFNRGAMALFYQLGYMTTSRQMSKRLDVPV